MDDAYKKPVRNQTVTQKVKTPFGSMYLHLQMDDNNVPVGGSISHPFKEPNSTIAKLVDNLSEGLNTLLTVNDESGEPSDGN